MSGEISPIRTVNDQNVDREDLEDEQIEALMKEDRAIVRHIRDVQNVIDISVLITVQDRTRQKNGKNTAQICRDRVSSTTDIVASMAQNIPIRDVLALQNAFKGDNGRQSPTGEFKTLKGDDNGRCLPYREGM